MLAKRQRRNSCAMARMIVRKEVGGVVGVVEKWSNAERRARVLVAHTMRNVLCGARRDGLLHFLLPLPHARGGTSGLGVLVALLRQPAKA
jgi:hypothetical protein